MQLKKEISVYFAGKVMSYASPILLIPVLTNVLSTEDYGVVGTYIAIYHVLNTFIGLSATGAVVRAYMDKDDSDFDFSCYLFNALSVNFLLFLLALTPLYLLSAFSFMSLPLTVVILLPVIVSLATFKAYKHKLWNIQKKAVNYSLFDVTFNLALLALSALLVLTLLPDWRGRIYAITCLEALFCLISVYFLYKEDGIKFTFNGKYMKSVLMYGLPLIPHSMGLTLLASADKLLLNNMVGLSGVGVYAVAVSAASLLMIVTIPIEQALNPYVFELFKKRTELGDKRYIVGFWIYLAIAVLMALLFYFVLSFAIPLVVGEAFKAAKEYVGILLVGQVCHAMYRYVIKAVYFSKKTHLVSITTVTSGLIGLGCQIIFIKSNGIVGAAIGASIGYFLSFLIAWYYSNRLQPMPWKKSPKYLLHIRTLFG